MKKDLRIKQCCSCEKVFKKFKKEKERVCPYCFSGNWVYGYIDEPERRGEKMKLTQKQKKHRKICPYKKKFKCIQCQNENKQN